QHACQAAQCLLEPLDRRRGKRSRTAFGACPGPIAKALDGVIAMPRRAATATPAEQQTGQNEHMEAAAPATGAKTRSTSGI
ncbi:hypothetical protein, partial [Mesorhizobium sp. M4A.F.Ca.ET.022.05.2.1]|uniref:hypothetical protein n=1 Tax=Mesorhizobium sp. M4A.F.Ca.ET.022.05.2.1 TaxID=2496653 RepID=UPI001AECB3B9